MTERIFSKIREKCKFYCGMTEDHDCHRVYGNYHDLVTEYGEPELEYCSHPDNKGNDCEGNCNQYDCPWGALETKGGIYGGYWEYSTWKRMRKNK